MPSWVHSTCYDPQWNMGYPGQGAYAWTATFGTVWVGSDWAPYAQQGFECGALREPVKPAGYISEKNAYGQWFRGGLIWWAPGGYWVVELGDWGQTGGRLDGRIVGLERAEGDGSARPPGYATPAPPVPRPPSKLRRVVRARGKAA